MLHLELSRFISLLDRVSIRMSSWKSSILLIAAVAFCGCSPANPVGTVKGTATLKGKPYNDAAIMFVSLEKGLGSGGDLQTDGSFALTDPLPVGSYVVYLAPKSIPAEEASAAPVPMHMDKTVPSKYWSEASSDIKVDVKEGENVIPIDIK